MASWDHEDLKSQQYKSMYTDPRSKQKIAVLDYYEEDLLVRGLTKHTVDRKLVWQADYFKDSWQAQYQRSDILIMFSWIQDEGPKLCIQRYGYPSTRVEISRSFNLNELRDAILEVGAGA